MADPMAIVALLVAAGFSFRGLVVSESHCDVANRPRGPFADVLGLSWLQYALDLVDGLVSGFQKAGG